MQISNRNNNNYNNMRCVKCTAKYSQDGIELYSIPWQSGAFGGHRGHIGTKCHHMSINDRHVSNQTASFALCGQRIYRNSLNNRGMRPFLLLTVSVSWLICVFHVNIFPWLSHHSKVTMFYHDCWKYRMIIIFISMMWRKIFNINLESFLSCTLVLKW